MAWDWRPICTGAEMRLRELKFPILIRLQIELQAGRGAGLHRTASERFDLIWTSSFEDGRYDDAEIIDSDGQVYCVNKIFFMRLRIWQNFMYRFWNLFVFNLSALRKLTNVDMELEPTRKLALHQFKTEYLELILAHPNWWKRWASRSEVEELFSEATSFSEAFDEIGWSFSPADNLVHRGKSQKIVDLR